MGMGPIYTNKRLRPTSPKPDSNLAIDKSGSLCRAGLDCALERQLFTVQNGWEVIRCQRLATLMYFSLPRQPRGLDVRRIDDNTVLNCL